MRRSRLPAVLLALLAAFSTVHAAAPLTACDAPATLSNLDRTVRFLSLPEARATALENGFIEQPSLLFPNVGLDDLITGSDTASVRVLAGDKPKTKSLVVAGVHRDVRTPESKRKVYQTLLNVENAYWNLYGSYWQLNSREQGLRFAYETWKITQEQYRVGKVSRAAVAQAEGQYNLFRSQRLQAIDTVLDNERQLRAMMGLRIEDGLRLVPSDAPTLVESKPDWKEGWNHAMKHRPELTLARQDVKVARLNVQLAKNYLQPDLRSHVNGDSKAVDNRLDGSSGSNAFRNLASNTYNDWSVGLRMGMPLGGFRFAHAQLRDSQAQLARASLVLQDQEAKAERYLGLWYRRMSSAYFQIKAARTQRETFAEQLRIRYELYRKGASEPGTDNPVTLNLLLESQRFWAEALATEYQAIVTYNNALCGWEYAKGDVCKYAHVRLSAGSGCAGCTVDAVEYQRQRTQRRVRHEQALPAREPGKIVDDCPATLQKSAPSLVALWKSSLPLQDAPDLSAIQGCSTSSLPVQSCLIERKASEIFPPRSRHRKATH